MSRQVLLVLGLGNFDEDARLHVPGRLLEDARQRRQARGVGHQQLPDGIGRRRIKPARAVDGDAVAGRGLLRPFAGHAAFMHHEVDIDFACIRAEPAHGIGRAANLVLPIGIGPAPVLGNRGQVELARVFMGKEQAQIFVADARGTEAGQPIAAKGQGGPCLVSAAGGQHRRFVEDIAHGSMPSRDQSRGRHHRSRGNDAQQPAGGLLHIMTQSVKL